MFQILFKYPIAVFSKGDFVLLGAWPKWILCVLIAGSAAGLAYLIRSRLVGAAAGLRSWRAGVIWLLESLLAALLLVLLWQPAILIAELKPQQNVIAILVDDSRSMGISEGGVTREAQAIKALQGGVLTALERNFQARLYRLNDHLTQVSDLKELGEASAPSTHIGESLRQLVAETSDLPIGAVILLSDGSDNSGGIDLDTISALRNRHIPVHTVGLGAEQMPNDAEIDDVIVSPHAMADSRLAATVSFHQSGYAGRKTTLSVRDGEKTLASQDITYSADKNTQTETLLFNVGAAGAKNLQFSIEALPSEENRANNSVMRLVRVESDKRRVLYVEGEPRWEYKFIRRAEDDDRIVQIVSMLRTTENKIYRQGISDPKELADGFPTRAEDLFGYQAILIGSVEAGYFTPAQQDLIREFVDRRGGGLLLLGGRFALADGIWGGSNLADLLPVTLPNRKDTFHRAPATAELTPAGADSIICRLVDDSDRNVQRWKKLPYLMDYQDAGTPKPGAVVLAEMKGGGREMPMLITENYGRGRTAVLATSGTWRWKMSQPLGDTTHDMFWHQLLRWLVSDTPGGVVASVSNQALFDDGHIRLSAEVRDKEFKPAADARVEAHVTGPNGISAMVEMSPAPDTPGVFQADWSAEKPGSYIAEITAARGQEVLGSDAVMFQRRDGVAESFHTGQNRELLERLASQTGGRYWRPEELSKLSSEIPYSEAGITVRETKELWNMPAIFLAIILLRFSEWLLRRKWGIV
ncbi:MAG TPA: glutamine amidotransferase [Candidatus Acidoferrales bacterium]|nr:glutamine amidotransferase [Candidatus Acidoferrales bacterium]